MWFTGSMSEPAATEIEQVTAAFEAYEAALLANDVDAINAAFWDDPATLRFGIGEMQVGYAAVAAWRATAPPVSPQRTITSRRVLHLAPGAVAVDITFANGSDPSIGRQSQTWIRTDQGWRIARAHVSVIPG